MSNGGAGVSVVEGVETEVAPPPPPPPPPTTRVRLSQENMLPVWFDWTFEQFSMVVPDALASTCATISIVTASPEGKVPILSVTVLKLTVTSP
jgi:hypothetical protein